MDKIKIGIVPSPGTPAQIVNKIINNLNEVLQQEISQNITWEIDTVTDRLTGAADSVKTILKQAVHIRNYKDWDYVVSVTDLPIFYEKVIVLADANVEERVSQISLPAFGMMPNKGKVQRTIIQMIKELYYQQQESDNLRFRKRGIGVEENTQKNSTKKFLSNFRMSQVRRYEFDQTIDGLTVRFLIHPIWNGRLKILAGMTIANRPWSILPSFKKVTGLAFATGSYMLIFTTLWQLSSVYDWPRFFSFALLATIGMVVWIVFVHNLWEGKAANSSRKLRNLYNTTTITTLGIAVIIFYITIFLLFLFAVHIIVPTGPFAEVIGHQPSFVDYVKLSWLASSAATVAGAIGAGLENEEEIRKSAYGYRQYVRSLEAKKEEEKEKEKEQKEQEEKEQEQSNAE